MPTLKIFHIGGGHMHMPSKWLDVVNTDPRRQKSGVLTVVAYSKKDVAALMVDRGLEQWHADNAAAASRVQREPNPQSALYLALTSGMVDPTTPGVYFWRAMPVIGPVVRVELDHSLTVIGHFRYDGTFGGRGTYVELAP